MIAKYQFGESGQEPHTKTRAKKVEAAFNDVLGEDVSLVDKLTVPSHIGGIPNGAGVTLEMSKRANKTVRDKLDFFSLSKNLPGYFGESHGPSNVTSQVISKNLTIDQVLRILSDNGDLQRAIDVIEENRQVGDPESITILAYAIFKFSLGWDAEKIFTQSGDFKKGNTAQDKGGIDGWYNGQPVQVKPGTEFTSKGSGSFGAKKFTHLFYLWGHDGTLRIATADDYLEMKDELHQESGIPKTLIDKSENLAGDDLNRRFRYLWW